MAEIRYNQTDISLKRIIQTKTFAQLIHAHDGNYYFKTHYPMWAELHPVPFHPKFIKLFIDGVESNPGTDWIWGAHPGAPSAFAHDNIRVLNLAGSTYRLEYVERHIPYVPSILLTRSDGNHFNSSKIKARTHTDDLPNAWRIIWSLAALPDPLTYSAEYRFPDGNAGPGHWGQVINRGYGTDFVVIDFERLASTVPWYIELWKIGSNTDSGGSGKSIGGFKSGMTPLFVYSTNMVPIPDPTSEAVGTFMVRLRNNDDNTVTAFADRKLVTRRISLWQPGAIGDIYIGKYFMTRLV